MLAAIEKDSLKRDATLRARKLRMDPNSNNTASNTNNAGYIDSFWDLHETNSDWAVVDRVHCGVGGSTPDHAARNTASTVHKNKTAWKTSKSEILSLLKPGLWNRRYVLQVLAKRLPNVSPKPAT